MELYYRYTGHNKMNNVSDLRPYVTALSNYCRINYGVIAGGLGSF